MITNTAKRLVAQAAPPGVKALRNFLRTEAREPLPFSEPDLLRRGYHSNRRWLYPERPSTAKGYLRDTDYLRRLPELNPVSVREEFTDKLAFARTLEANGFGDRAPRLLGVSRDGRFEPTGARPAGEIIIKPVDGRAGAGIAAFDSMDAAVAACPPDRTYLVQERVRAHAYGRELFPGSLNAIRVQTFRTVPGTRAGVAAVVQRIGVRATAPGHAVSGGGLIARVAPDGTLMYALGPVRGPSRDRYDHHHETGARITGRALPCYDEALDLARDLMDLYPQATWIGWDIAIAEDGPIVLEGNATWPSMSGLQAHGPFADQPDVREYCVQRGLLPGA